MFDMAVLADEIAAIVRDEVAQTVSPIMIEYKALQERLAALEGRSDPILLLDDAVARAIAALPAPAIDLDRVTDLVETQVSEGIAALPPAEPGKDADPELVNSLVDDAVARAVAALPTPALDFDRVAELIKTQVSEGIAALPPAAPGRDADPALVNSLVDEAVARAVSALPPPPAGRDADMVEVAQMVSRQVEDAVAALPAPAAGRDADPEQVAALVDKAVRVAVDALPTPAPGRDADIEEVKALVRSAVTKAVSELPVLKGDDGEGVADLLVDRAGNLIATFTDGRTKSLGQIVGKDGIDGLSADDLACELAEDGRTVAFKLVRGDIERSFSLAFPVVLDRGVYQERAYDRGDAVTWAGSLWIAQRSTSAKPDSPDSGWRLAVKRGRDGKDRLAGAA